MPAAPVARDPVVRALGGLGTGAFAGAAIVTAGLLVLRSVQRGRIVETQDTGFMLLAVTVFVALLAAAAAGWLLTSGIAEAWRRGVTATLAVFGMLMLSLMAVPADLLAGRSGLFAYLLLLLGGGTRAYRQARRAGAA